ncbi:MAG: DUF975 family protein, partial [Oscillospiraceae bacterium]|nr:DUF975 family protein [Oscillospiraceae bacterium]
MEYDRARLKQTARQAMRFQRPHPMLITLLFIILTNIGTQIVSRILGAASGSNTLSTVYAQAMLQYEDPERALQYVLLSFTPQRLALALFVGVFIAGVVTSLWAGLMRTGYSGFCLDMVRGRQPQTDALFSVFPQWASVLFTQFLAELFRMLWVVLLGVGLIVVIFVDALLLVHVEVLFLLVLLAAYIAFFVGLAWVLLRYAMVDFLIADQGLTGMDAIRESKRLMRGNTGRLFTLNLSFIGWYLLEIGILLLFSVIGAVAFGAGLSASGLDDPMYLIAGASLGIIGLVLVAGIIIGIFNLWLTPYVTGAQALFYDWLRGVDSTPAGGYGFGPSGGWGQPQAPQQNTGYTWNPAPGPRAGEGIGAGGGAPPQPPPPLGLRHSGRCRRRA